MVLCLISCVANDCQHEGSWNKRLEMREVITKLIVGLNNNMHKINSNLFTKSKYTYQAVGLLEPHAIDDNGRGANEEDLHKGVVN